MNSSIWPIDKSLTGTLTPRRSGPESNSNEGAIHIPQTVTGTSPSDAFQCHTQDTSYIWPVDETLIGTTTQGQSGPGSNGYEGVLHIPKSPRLEPYHQM